MHVVIRDHLTNFSNYIFQFSSIKSQMKISKEKYTSSVQQPGALPEDVDQGSPHMQIVEDSSALVAPCLIDAHKISANDQDKKTSK